MIVLTGRIAIWIVFGSVFVLVGIIPVLVVLIGFFFQLAKFFFHTGVFFFHPADGFPLGLACHHGINRRDIKVKEENAMEEDVEIAQNMPYKEMANRGWVLDVTKKTEQVVHLRKYFELAQLKYLQTTLTPRIACRTVNTKDKSECALIAWAQKAKLEVRHIETKTINIEKLKNKITAIKQMLSLEWDDFREKLVEELSGCGVAVVFVPRISGDAVKGATFLDGNKIVLGLVLCDDREELHYILFHELAHILYGHLEREEGLSEEDELCADEFAKKMIG